MAFALQLSSLSEEHKKLILKNCIIKPSATQYDLNPEALQCYSTNKKEDEILLPLGCWKQFLNENDGFPNGEAEDYPQMNANAKFTKPLLTIDTDPQKRKRDQDVICAEALKKIETGSVFLALFTGLGKCLAKGTEILMFNGEKKPVEEIQVGELIMGDDSTSRTILSTCTGKEEMYEIVPNKGESFTVNESHILTLKASGQGRVDYDKIHNVYIVKWFDGRDCKSKSFNIKEDAELFSSKLVSNVFDIALKDYLNLNISGKHILKAFWAPIAYQHQDIILDPYFLGLWLGDGSKSYPLITNIDKEIIDYLKNYAIDHNLHLNISKGTNTEACHYRFSRINKKLSNSLMAELRKLNVINNKHIPLLYKANSKEVRLQLLAGFIDSDGYYHKGCYEIIQKLKILADGIQDICRSLGFGCFTKECRKGCWYKGEYREGTYYRVWFSGVGLEEIPVLLPRKKAAIRLQKKDPTVTSFKVVPKGVGEYYGFCIDGNKRFLLGTHMVTHNTSMSVYLSIKLKLKTVVLCHLDVVKKQWPDSYAEFSGDSVKVQYVKGNVKMDSTADVYIMGIKKCLNIDPDDLLTIGTVIIDEAHICTIAAFTQVLLRFRPRYLIGLSATYDRSDGLQSLLYPYFGTIENFIVRKEKKPFVVYKVQTDFEPELKYKKRQGVMCPDWNLVVNSIEKNPERWQLIVDIVLKHPNEKIIILCNRKILSQGIYDLLIKYNESVELYIDKTKNYNKKSRIVVTGFRKGGVGLDDKLLTMAIIASDTKDVRQYEGRVRVSNNIIYHIVDNYKSFQKHYKECEKWYIEKGATMKSVHAKTIMAVKHWPQYLLLKHIHLIMDIKNNILTNYIHLCLD